jgi:hypothetical protein
LVQIQAVRNLVFENGPELSSSLAILQAVSPSGSMNSVREIWPGWFEEAMEILSMNSPKFYP